MSLKNRALYFIIFLGISEFTYGLFFFSRPEPKKIVTIMIDPAGDAQHTGRKLNDTFERGISLQIAEKLKNILEERLTHVKIVLSRLPGESASYLQHASFANRLNVDFYLGIHCYQEKETKPCVYLYQFSYGDNFITKQFDLALIPYDQAHLANNATTNSFAIAMQDILGSNAYANIYNAKGIFKIPFKPLIGIKAPAIGLELGIKTKDDWHDYVEPIASSLIPIVEKLS